MSKLQDLADQVRQLGSATESASAQLAALTKRIEQMQQQLVSAGRAGVDVESVRNSLSATSSLARSATASAAQASQLAKQFANSLAGIGGRSGGSSGHGSNDGLPGSAIPGGREFLSDTPENQPLKRDAARMNTQYGYYTVAMHGDTNGKEVLMQETLIGANKLAEVIQSDSAWNNQPVFMLACHTGEGNNPIGQQLADLLGVPVRAPNGVAVVSQSTGDPVAYKVQQTDVGDIFIKSSFLTFLPRSS